MKKVGDSIVSRIKGETEEKNIADTFATHFESIYGGHNSHEHILLKEDFNVSFARYFAGHIDDDNSPFLLSWQD